MLANDTTNPPATNPPATMNAHERLTWDEICRRYPDEWVVVVAIQPVDATDEADEMDGGCCVPIEDCTAVVVTHGKNRRRLSPEIKALQAHHPSLGAFFTGRLIPPAYELVVPTTSEFTPDRLRAAVDRVTIESREEADQPLPGVFMGVLHARGMKGESSDALLGHELVHTIKQGAAPLVHGGALRDDSPAATQEGDDRLGRAAALQPSRALASARDVGPLVERVVAILAALRARRRLDGARPLDDGLGDASIAFQLALKLLDPRQVRHLAQIFGQRLPPGTAGPTRARVMQLLDFLLLAPDLQDAVLPEPRAVTHTGSWAEQRA